jgi:putative dehydrogenase
LNTKSKASPRARKAAASEPEVAPGSPLPAIAPAATPSQRVGVVGLGIMGSAMAGNLRRDGFRVWGFDPSPAAMKALKKMGGTACASAADLAGQVDVVITSLPSAAALQAAASDMATGAARGLIVIEASTLDIEDKRAARDLLAKSGVTLLDCPLSGTGAQAALKDLTIYASGPAAAIRKAQPVFKGFTSAQFDLGAFGNGMKMKIMANLLVAIHNVATAEALLLGQRWGISPRAAVKVLEGGAGGSRMLQVRGPQMQDEGWKTVTMKIAVWQKDMKLIAAALKDAGVPAPLFAATVPLYDAAMGMGHGLNDTAAVFDVLDRMSRPAG